MNNYVHRQHNLIPFELTVEWSLHMILILNASINLSKSTRSSLHFAGVHLYNNEFQDPFLERQQSTLWTTIHFMAPDPFLQVSQKTRNLKELLSISRPIISPGFTTQNDHIMSTKDACDMPAQRNVTMRPCGRDKISYDDCYQAGCCYKDGECYLPFVEEKVDYLFYSQKMRFKDARRECRKAGLNSFAVPENSNRTHTAPYY